ncbi:MAG: aminotransferase class, partial [Proteobacteria bacterium]|nr:aminotransferase class [Pseudomonadota bacterium]
MLDFTSALYLGLRHPSGSLRPWNSLTSGRPSAMTEPVGAATVASALARLQGCEKAVLLPSTLHLFIDLFDVLSADPVALYLDAHCYPIARWGAERMASRGVPVQDFPHNDPDGLYRAVRRSAGCRPVVVTDGFYPRGGGAAPLARYLSIVRRFDGMLVVDDTQALGILGQNPGPLAPYGMGGGGSLRFAKLRGPDIVIGASLAKGFGVPIAVLSGSRDLVERFASDARCRSHCSPPSIAVIHAAEHALAINRRFGDELRLRLAARVRRFRAALARIGVAAEGGLFPVQTLQPIPGLDPLSLLSSLRQQEIHPVPLRAAGTGDARLGFT